MGLMLNNQPIKGEVHLGKQTIGKMYYNNKLVYENYLESDTLLYGGNPIQSTFNLDKVNDTCSNIRGIRIYFNAHGDNTLRVTLPTDRAYVYFDKIGLPTYIDVTREELLSGFSYSYSKIGNTFTIRPSNGTEYNGLIRKIDSGKIKFSNGVCEYTPFSIYEYDWPWYSYITKITAL